MHAYGSLAGSFAKLLAPLISYRASPGVCNIILYSCMLDLCGSSVAQLKNRYTKANEEKGKTCHMVPFGPESVTCIIVIHCFANGGSDCHAAADRWWLAATAALCVC